MSELAFNLLSPPNNVRDYRFTAGISGIFPQAGSTLEMNSAPDGTAGVRGGGFEDLLRQRLDEARRTADTARQNPSTDAQRDAAPTTDTEKAAGTPDEQPSSLNDDEDDGEENQRYADGEAAIALVNSQAGKTKSGGAAAEGALDGEGARSAGFDLPGETQAAALSGDTDSRDAVPATGDDGLLITDTMPLFNNKGAVRTGAEAFTGETAEMFGGAEGIPAGLEVAEALNQKTAGAEKGRGGTGKTDVEAASLKGAERGDAGRNTAGAVFASFATTDTAGLKGGKAAGKEGAIDAVDAASKKKTALKKAAVSVADMRTGGTAGTAGADSAARLTADTARPEAVKDMVVELRNGWSDGSGAASQTGRETAAMERLTSADVKSAAQFESFLSRELHNNLNGDIVREASVMLRDGGKGLIRLKLYPEALGNVQVRLSLSGNTVQGVITVESQEALSAFEQERTALETAFRESGFEGASLNMQMSGGGSQERFDGTAAGAFSRSIAASEYGARAAAPRVESIREYEGFSIFA